MKAIFFDGYELEKAKLISELNYIYPKEDDTFIEFILKLKDISLEIYNFFKRTESLKKMYLKKLEFIVLLENLSSQLFVLYKKIINIELVCKIWNNFFNIYISIKDSCYNQNNVIEKIKKQTFKWLNLFESKYSPIQITTI